jgi:hypothetical protein
MKSNGEDGYMGGSMFTPPAPSIARNSSGHHQELAFQTGLPTPEISPTEYTMAKNFGNMQLAESHIRQDISLIGNPPPLEDLKDNQPTTLPSKASLTSSPFAQCDKTFKRCTLNALPRNPSELKKAKLPLSLILEPFPLIESENVSDL